MRKQIAAANWKMNLSLQEAQSLAHEIHTAETSLHEPGSAVIFCVPHPYLYPVLEIVRDHNGFGVAAQDCSAHESGAYTGEVSAPMLKSMGITHALVGHSERRDYHDESGELLARKIDVCLKNDIQPIFCCGEKLEAREGGGERDVVEQQLKEALFHLTAENLSNVVVAYEPVWAIGTGKTASAELAQEMHAFIRSVLAAQWGDAAAQNLSILYGGSVKASNAAEIFGMPDVDGGLVGGASLSTAEFLPIIKALKHPSEQ